MGKRMSWVIVIIFVINRITPVPADSVFYFMSERDHLPLPGSVLCIGDSDTCVVSDSTGHITFDFPIADSARMVVTAKGFSDTVFAFDTCSSDTTTVEMIAVQVPVPQERVISISEPCREVVVVAGRIRRSEETYRQSMVRFSAREITTSAGSADDLSRYLGSLPSAVSSLGEGYDNTLLVRGGRPTETIFLLDGIEMENINHFSKANGSGGPIGFVNTECIDSVNYYAGAIPVSFPSRLSAAVDIGMKSGIAEPASTSLGCKLTGGMLTSRGPLPAGKSAYSFSARYVDFTPLRTVIRDQGVPKLGDLFGKLTLAANDRLEVSATGILSHNRYRYSYPVVGTADDGSRFDNTMTSDERILQGGAGLTLRFRSERVSTSATAALSFRNGRDADILASLADAFYMKRYASNPVKEYIDNRARYTFTTDSRIAISDHQSASFGLRAAENRSAFAKSDQSRFSGECIYCEDDKPVTYTVEKFPESNATGFVADEASAFTEYIYSRGMFEANAGVRADYFRQIKALPFSPRISFSLHPARKGRITGSFGLYHQFPTDLPSMLFDCLASFPGMTHDSLQKTETMLLSGLQPERCWQTSLGFDKSLAFGMETRIETYYKWYDREFNFLGPDFQEVLKYSADGRLTFSEQNGKRKSRGVEATVARMRSKGAFFSLSGSVFDVKNRYKNGLWYNDWSDVEYTFYLSAGSRFRNGQQLSFSVQGAGGRPFCPQKISIDCINRKIARYDSSTAFFERRLDPLFAANARYSFTRQVRGIIIESSIEILNAFNYLPTLEYRFNGERFVEIKPFSITPILGCKVFL